MRVIRKINNNVAVGVDGNHHQVIIFGKGIGFGQIPYELTDMSKVDRTYYDIDVKYYNLLQEIPDSTFLMVTRLLDEARTKVKGNLNPNLPFILADHINFAIERYRKGMNIALPYSYEMEYEYPELTDVSKWFIRQVNERMHVTLHKGEITSITMHFLNALDGGGGQHDSTPDRTDRIISEVTQIVEDFFSMTVNKDGFHYFRFKNHVKFFVQRKERKEEFINSSEDLYQSMKEAYPSLCQCIAKIDDYMLQEFGERCPDDELLYLMIHVKNLYSKEDCNH